MRSEGNNQANPVCQVYHRTTEPTNLFTQAKAWGKKGQEGKGWFRFKKRLRNITLKSNLKLCLNSDLNEPIVMALEKRDFWTGEVLIMVQITKSRNDKEKISIFSI